jgi:DNA-binding transcriptional regulator PaaX
MDYNQLKLKILELLDESKEYESSQILTLVVAEGDTKHGDKAIEMALLRYWRQGLLKRERKRGRFYYALTEKGLARREWLRRVMVSSEA